MRKSDPGPAPTERNDGARTPRFSLRFASSSARSIVLVSILSAVLLVLAFYRSDPWIIAEHVSSVLRDRRWTFLVAAFGVDLIILMARVAKWRAILLPTKHVPLLSLFSAIVIGIASNNLLFFRFDELVRAYVLGTREKLSKGFVLGTIAVERAWDLTVILIVFGITGFAFAVTRELLLAGIVAAALCVCGLAALLLIARKEEGFVSLVRRLGDRFSLGAALARAASSFAGGVRAFPRDCRILWLLGASTAEWAGEILFVWLVTVAVGIELSLPAMMLFVVASFLSFATPSSPAAVGPYHFLGTCALYACAAPIELKNSFVVVAHAMMVIPVSIIGIFFLWREGLSFSRIHRRLQDG